MEERSTKLFGSDKSFTTAYLPPTVITEPASPVVRGKATLRGTVNPHESETTYQFEYGETTSYGSVVPIPAQAIGSGSSNVAVSQTIKGLEPAKTFHYRLKATNKEGATSYGEDDSFSTPKASFDPHWQIEGVPLAGLGIWPHFESHGQFTIESTKSGSPLRVSCNSTGSGILGIEETVALTGCSVTLNGAATKCTVANTQYELDGGFRNELAVLATFHFEGGTCVLPETMQLKGEGVSFHVRSESEAKRPALSITSGGLVLGVAAATVSENAGWSLTAPAAYAGKRFGYTRLAWRIAGAGVSGEESLASTGALTLAVTGATKVTFECAEVGKGGVSAGVALTINETYSCASSELPSCKFVSFPTSLSGTGAAVSFRENLFVLETTGGSCSWYPRTVFTMGEVNLTNPAGESQKQSVGLSGTGTFGGNLVTLSGTTTREMTGSHSAQVWGFNSKSLYQAQVTENIMSNPDGSVIDSAGNLWITDYTRLLEYSPAGLYLGKIAPTGEHALSSLKDVAIDSSGNFWLTESGHTRVVELNSKGEWIRNVGGASGTEGGFNSIRSIDIDKSGNLWVTSSGKYAVQKFNSKGEFVKVISLSASEGGVVGEPTGIDVAPNGNVWVAADSPDRIVKFNEAGEYLASYGSEGSGTGQLNNPGAIVVDSAQHVWVCDATNGRIEEFTEEGGYLTAIGSFGSGVGQFKMSPLQGGISIDSFGNLWVSDMTNLRVQEWSTT